MKRAVVGIIVSLCCCVLFSSVCCADTGASAREVVNKYKDAVVTVHLVVETTMSFEGESSKREAKIVATAFVIHPSGLSVTSLSEVDPTEAFSAFSFFEDEEGFSQTTRVVDVKIRLEDGTELPADVVLRDPDLDLAFIKPKDTPKEPLPFVDLTQASEPQMLDEIVFLSRLGAVGNREIAAHTEQVRAVLTKPRKFYVVGGDLSSTGVPAFALDGKPVGMLILRTAPNAGRDMEGFSSFSESIMAAVLPCSTVARAAEQALTSKPVAKVDN